MSRNRIEVLVGVAILLWVGSILPATAAGDLDVGLAEVQAEIANNGEDWIAGPTSVSDLTAEEKARMLGARFDEEHWREHASGWIVGTEPRDLPAYFSWRDQGGMTAARNQGGCGSCWCFGPTGAFEGLIKIYRGIDTNLSEQQGLVCSEHPNGCDGGLSGYVANVQMTMGQVSESCMPYTGNDNGACVDDECESVDRIRGYDAVAYDEVALKTALMIGPLAVNMYAPGSFFYYNGGCFQYSGNDPINHCVVLCGWDDNACSGQGAWQIKNSWGTGWGDSGFGWVRMGDCLLGSGAILLDYVPTPVRLGYDAVAVVDAGDGFLGAGETAQLKVTLRNYGRENATGITAYLSTTTVGVTILDPSASYPNIPAEGSAESVAPHFTVQVAPGTTGPIQFDLSIASDQVANQASSFPLIIGETETFYSAGFETGTDGWTHGGTADDWRRGTLSRTFPGKPDPRSAARGNYVFGNDLNETGSWNTIYATNADSWLESPSIDCTGREGVYLLFRRWLTVQRRPSDFARVYVNDQVVFENPLFVHVVDDCWQEILYDISAIADNNPDVRIRFALDTGPNINYGGWNVDEVQLVVPTGNPAGAGDLPLAWAGLEIATYPNPFQPVVNLRLSIPSSAEAPSVRVYDAAGRLARTIEIGAVGEGVHWTSWNGTDQSGRRLPAGLYFLKVALDGREVTSRVLMLE